MIFSASGAVAVCSQLWMGQEPTGSKDPELNKAGKDLVPVGLPLYLKETENKETNINTLQTMINVLKRMTPCVIIIEGIDYVMVWGKNTLEKLKI